MEENGGRTSLPRAHGARRLPCLLYTSNTYFAPNQPRPRRCYELGQAIRKAVETYAGDARIGIIASGGLSHFLVDEDFDRAILKACADKDAKFLQTLPRNKLHLSLIHIFIALPGIAHVEIALERRRARVEAFFGKLARRFRLDVAEQLLGVRRIEPIERAEFGADVVVQNVRAQ